MIRRWAVLAVVAATVVPLATLSPSPAEALRSVQQAGTATDPTAPVVAVLTLAAQALALWLVVATLVTLAEGLPGRAGRLGAALARRCVPAVVRRSLEVVLGVTVTVGTLSGSTALAAAPPVSSDPLSTASVASAREPTGTTGTPAPDPAGPAPDRSAAPWSDADLLDLDWPVRTTLPSAPAPTTTPAPAAPTAPTAPTTLPPPTTPLATGDAPAAAEATPSAAASLRESPPAARPPAVTEAPRAPVRSPAAVPAATDPARPAPERADVVVVRPGDTLWSLAASALERTHAHPPTAGAIARSWPRWWAANREAIGDDPDLILPGTSLTPPPDVVPATSRAGTAATRPASGS